MNSPYFSRCFFVSAVASLSLIASADLPEPVSAELKRAHIKPESVAIIVKQFTPDAIINDRGDVIISHRADVAMNPASTMKLLTSAVALDTLGPAWHWKTEIYTVGDIRDGMLHGNVYIKGYGDPHLTFEQVWLMLRALRAQGIQRIGGDLVLDRSYFRLPVSSTTLPFDDSPERAYNVAPDSLLMNFKAVRFDIASDSNTITIGTEPPLPGLHALSAMKINQGNCEQWLAGWRNPTFIEHEQETDVTLQGSFPANCRASRYLSVFNAPEFAGRLIRELWNELGGSIDGMTHEGLAPAQAQLMVTWPSEDLATILREVNKLSNNTMARTIYLTLGTERGPADLDSASAAQRVIGNWIADHNLTFPELTLENGSGLSRLERISVAHLADVIETAGRSAFGPELISSLPIVAVDGTMKKRLIHSPAAGQGHIKTGTLDDVKAMAGIMRDREGKQWIVVAMANGSGADAAQAAFDALLNWVWADCKMGTTCPTN